MVSSKRRLAVVWLCGLVGCNAILGNEDHALAPSVMGGGGAGGATAKGGAGSGSSGRAGDGGQNDTPAAGGQGEGGDDANTAGASSGTGFGGEPANTGGSGNAGSSPSLSCEETPCFDGDPTLVGHGECKAGKPVCEADELVDCELQVLPRVELCGGAFDGSDENCDDEKTCTGAVLRGSSKLSKGYASGSFWRIQLDAKGNEYVLADYYEPFSIGTHTLPGSGAQGDILLAKFDSKGKALWAKGLTGNGWQLGRDLAVNPDGTFTAAGIFTTQGAPFSLGGKDLTTSNVGNASAFVARFDSSGNPLWVNSIEPVSTNSSLFDIPTPVHLAAKPGGGVYVWFITNQPIVYNHAGGSLDAEPTFGDEEWNQPLSSFAYLLEIDASGALVQHLAGGWINEVAGSEILLAPNGTLWVSGYSDEANGFDFGDIGKQYVESPGFLLKVLPNGSTTSTFQTDWAENIGELTTNDAKLAADSSGNVFLTGSGVFLRKVNPQGGSTWTLDVSGVSTQGITVDSAGYVSVVGSCQGQLDFAPGKPGGEIAANASGGDFCVAKYTGDGDYLWAKVLGDQASQSARAITADPLGYLHVLGLVQGTMNLDGVLDAGDGRAFLRTVLFP
jgi:hypothetical protein